MANKYGKVLRNHDKIDLHGNETMNFFMYTILEKLIANLGPSPNEAWQSWP